MSTNQQDLERRKENITSIEPLVSAMRTISLSQWRMALNRQETLSKFVEEIEHTIAVLKTKYMDGYAQLAISGGILIILGSNRGLCGNFNKRLLAHAQETGLTEKRYERVFLAGKQLPKFFTNISASPLSSVDFPGLKDIPQATSYFDIEAADRFESQSVTVLFNEYKGASRYQPVSRQIYPLQHKNATESPLEGLEVILDTDPASMMHHLDNLLFSAHLQECLYSSLSSEHSARFALMENADQNVTNLISELEILLQEYRKGMITTETQELAAASGLLNS